MNSKSILQAALGGILGAVTASVIYGVSSSVMGYEESSFLWEALVIAGASFAIIFLLFLLEFAFWSDVKKLQQRTTPLP